MCNALYLRRAKFEVVAPKKTLEDYQPDFPVTRWGILNGPLWEQFDLPLFLSKQGNPLLLSFSGLGPLFYKKQVITIHDLAFMVNPEWFSKKYYWFYKFCTPVIAGNARKIITVSNCSKSEISKLLCIPSEKIEVIYNSVKFNYTDEITPEKPVEGKYILSVSSIDARKNLARLVEAYNKTGISGDYKLVVAGKTDRVFSKKLTEDIAGISIGYVSDRELVLLYKSASVFVYTSLYEGFGIPVLEAMSFGCPVVISDIPVFREVFRDAGCFVNPNSTTSIQKGILKVLTDHEYRSSLIERGYKCAAKYNLEKSADDLINLINSL
jgi:glycosyltransferase involved in cell wall biosynthesis